MRPNGTIRFLAISIWERNMSQVHIFSPLDKLNIFLFQLLLKKLSLLFRGISAVSSLDLIKIVRPIRKPLHCFTIIKTWVTMNFKTIKQGGGGQDISVQHCTYINCWGRTCGLFHFVYKELSVWVEDNGICHLSRNIELHNYVWFVRCLFLTFCRLLLEYVLEIWSVHALSELPQCPVFRTLSEVIHLISFSFEFPQNIIAFNVY